MTLLAAGREDLITELRTLILTDLAPLDEAELLNDSPLVDDILDSLGIAELAVFIEDHIGRALEPEEEVRATFASVDAIIDFVLTHQQS